MRFYDILQYIYKQHLSVLMEKDKIEKSLNDIIKIQEK